MKKICKNLKLWKVEKTDTERWIQHDGEEVENDSMETASDLETVIAPGKVLDIRKRASKKARDRQRGRGRSANVQFRASNMAAITGVYARFSNSFKVACGKFFHTGKYL